MDKYILTSLIIIIHFLVVIGGSLTYLIYLKERELDKKKISEIEKLDVRVLIYKNIGWTFIGVSLVFLGVWYFSQP